MMSHTTEGHDFDISSLLSGSPTLHHNFSHPVTRGADGSTEYQEDSRVPYGNLSPSWSPGAVAPSSAFQQGYTTSPVGPKASETSAISYRQQFATAATAGPPSMFRLDRAAHYSSGRLHMPLDRLSRPSAPGAQQGMGIDDIGGQASLGDFSSVDEIRYQQGRGMAAPSARHTRKRPAEEVELIIDSDEEDVSPKRLKYDDLDPTDDSLRDNRTRQRDIRKERTDGAKRLRAAIPDEHFQRYACGKTGSQGFFMHIAADYIVQVQARMEELRRSHEDLKELCLALAKDPSDRREMSQGTGRGVSQVKEGEPRDGSESTVQGQTPSRAADSPLAYTA
ncbi:hypothetical protein DENSPDRAFT_840288 [Dentipellis sp. KUC8613]|nr:hypothetical protein DENSPDRAFT_840288 [Dentipellis sp. KUC8613]